METVLIIDGENFKKKIQAVFFEQAKKRPIWHEYNFKGLLDKVLQGIEVNRRIFYFAKIKEDPQTKEKSKHLINVLDRPFLAYVLDNIFEAGYREIILVAGFQKELMEIITLRNQNCKMLWTKYLS